MWSSEEQDEEQQPRRKYKQYSKRRSYAAKAQKPIVIDDDEDHAFNAMLRLLTRREYSVAELTSKLKKYYSTGAIAKALKKAQEMNYQSDERYASMLARHMEYTLHGPAKFRFEAKRKGLHDALISESEGEIDWDQLALQALYKKYGPRVDLEWEEQNKALAYLARRGFSTGSCMKAVQALCHGSSLEDDE